MNTPIVIITRNKQNTTQTIGRCSVYDTDWTLLFSSLTLERGWNFNQQNISCMPTGEYDLELEYSNRFKKLLWELKDVPGRSEIKFHSASFFYDLKGCIALGQYRKDLNKDGNYDLGASRDTMRSFHKVLKGFTKVKLIVEECL